MCWKVAHWLNLELSYFRGCLINIESVSRVAVDGCVIWFCDGMGKSLLLKHTKEEEDFTSSINADTKSVALLGAPTCIVADQGRCFASKEFRDFVMSMISN